MRVDQDTFIYDGDCGLCQSTVDWLRPRSDGSIRFAPATPATLADTGLGAADTDRAAVLVTTTGRRLDGSLAIGEGLRRSPKYDRNLLGRLLLEQPSRTIGEWIYSWVAKNRHRLSQGGGGACGITR